MGQVGKDKRELNRALDALYEVRRERDEAREAARALFWLPRGCQRSLETERWLEAYPWLEEGACGREAGAVE